MDLNVLTVCGLRALECLIAVDSMAYFEAKCDRSLSNCALFF